MLKAAMIAGLVVAGVTAFGDNRLAQIEQERQAKLATLSSTYNKQLGAINTEAISRYKVLLASYKAGGKEEEAGKCQDWIGKLAQAAGGGATFGAEDFTTCGEWTIRDQSLMGKGGFVILPLPEQFSSVSFKAEVESEGEFKLLLAGTQIAFGKGLEALVGMWRNEKSFAQLDGNRIQESFVNYSLPKGRVRYEFVYDGRQVRVLVDDKKVFACAVTTPVKPKFLCISTGWSGTTMVSHPIVKVN